jgi:UDP-glucuronate 4-epimerase
MVGFGHVLEGCRHGNVTHLVYASSSSVYGGNTRLPFSEHQGVDHPVSLYAASKKANELMAHTYSHLFQLPATGLRFFTVYGPWGRPDMALFLFTKAMLAGEPIKLFNNGQMVRDFTYIDDIVESLVRVLDKPATGDPNFDPAAPDPAISWAPHRLFNIGNARPTPLSDYIAAIERAVGVKAKLDLQPMQPGDLPATAADIRDLEAWIGFRPNTPVAVGVERFVAWYREFYRV